jgi:DNA-binding Lrp family transcriptional regulator
MTRETLSFDILCFYLENPTATQKEAADNIGVSLATLQRGIKRLKEDCSLEKGKLIAHVDKYFNSYKMGLGVDKLSLRDESPEEEADTFLKRTLKEKAEENSVFLRSFERINVGTTYDYFATCVSKDPKDFYVFSQDVKWLPYVKEVDVFITSEIE